MIHDSNAILGDGIPRKTLGMLGMWLEKKASRFVGGERFRMKHWVNQSFVQDFLCISKLKQRNRADVS